MNIQTIPCKDMGIHVYDNFGRKSSELKAGDFNPYEQRIKNIFNYGGSVRINGEHIGSHNLLAKRLEENGYTLTG